MSQSAEQGTGWEKTLVLRVCEYGNFRLTEAGVVASWNLGAHASRDTAIKGYSAHEIVGQHFSIFYLPEDREAGVPDAVLRTARDDGKRAFRLFHETGLPRTHHEASITRLRGFRRALRAYFTL
ncbi:hypothetical protein E1N52_35810 [Paraburkholderia guartelaensis]|uniref:Uncharacterized protein n=1 Tax=Paraburkholderia guartelaensis TaxID=2546446 RepID=A0A4R5L3S5_9BURK|nr:hypothetical protein [Paraburkholderia guartelaensis]TDG03250.1 hypothetical protein E1N52_35810 [Paraburkholderia guartelaensis]